MKQIRFPATLCAQRYLSKSVLLILLPFDCHRCFWNQNVIKMLRGSMTIFIVIGAVMKTLATFHYTRLLIGIPIMGIINLLQMEGIFSIDSKEQEFWWLLICSSCPDSVHKRQGRVSCMKCFQWINCQGCLQKFGVLYYMLHDSRKCQQVVYHSAAQHLVAQVQ